MTTNRLVFVALFVGFLGACGGRSTLGIIHDGGKGADSGLQADGKRDGTTNADSARPTDGRADGVNPDSPGVDAADANLMDGRADVVAPDGRADVAAPDGRADGTAPDGRADGGAPDGIADVATREARGGEAGGTDAAPTLTSLEIAPPSVTIAVGVPYGGLVVTAVFSDGSTADVTAQTTLTSGDSTIVQVSGRTLSGLKAG
jgi:hypothetical protein